MGFKIIGEKVEAIFIDRINRFEAKVLLNNQEIVAHVPNTGRLKELLIPNSIVYLVKSNNKNRKHEYTLMFVKKGKNLICINSVMANRVLESAISEKILHFGDGILRREVTFYDSKFDFLIDGEEKTFIEVKCVTLEENGIAKFPDAPTDRGRRHIKELIKAVEMGYKTKIIFVVFMDYVVRFEPNYKMDEKFAQILKIAKDNGVDVLAYKCKISLDEIGIENRIEIM